MSEFKTYLSESAAAMFRLILKGIHESGFNAVSFPMLMYGILNSNEENNPLDRYFTDNNLPYEDIHQSLVNLINFHTMNLESQNSSDSLQMIKYPIRFNRQTNDSKQDIKKSLRKSKKTSQTNNNLNSYKADLESIVANILLKDINGKAIKLPVDATVYSIFKKVFQYIDKYSIKVLEVYHFIPAMFEVPNKELKIFFEQNELDFADAKKYFATEKIFKLSIIPIELVSFLNVMNDKADIHKPCEILMRDKECNSLWNIMLKKNKRNAVIVGEAGVGKTAIVEKITYDIEAGTAPAEFKDFKVISADINALIAGTTYRGQAEERIKGLIEFLETNSKIILFIDEVHTILGAGSTSTGTMDLANALKPILARGDTIVIGATTTEEYEKYFKSDSALSRRFEKDEVKEPTAAEVYPMIKNKLDALSDFHRVQISKEIVDYAILIANCFAFDKKNPDKTLDLVDRAMVTAKRSGKKSVDKESVISNFGIFFDTWNQMSDGAKKSTAYHEIGHYIVGKSSDKLVNRTYLAVSIMPAEEYLGVTVMEYNKDSVPFADINYYIDVIASDLAGRVSEKMFTGTYTSGASNDLKSATRTAYNAVTKLGLIESNKAFINRVYIDSNDEAMFSEKATNLINDEINKLIERAYKRAEELLTENKDILDALVDVLLQKHIMSEAELDKVWKDTVAQRKDEPINPETKVIS